MKAEYATAASSRCQDIQGYKMKCIKITAQQGSNAKQKKNLDTC